ncbi:histidinol-phosphate transaminase [Dyadobacter fermentans]|uniref:Histidinol-phosphate aminotransferase n=1 Tax=Dyadobacter fermentans (strain ATCC 700827 / DSM 18053 / CIP 107007 / KCTC 52180 / NS114) TaxID=471854 RepID=C6W527_DYAFD|nr:histidinol-phosphate transaminase [Dyadobacter fermentans]ACT92387.1 histidinol-phosphate aminotransferase [Dyadobacter fermentans DSM 18053]
MNNSFDLQKLLRPHILTLAPYSSARDEYTGHVGVFLDANENPYGSVTGENFNRYPDPYQAEIKQKLSPIKQVSPDRIFLGNGSDEPIDLLTRATCTPGQDRVIIMPPTYGMYEVSASIHDVKLDKVSLTSDYHIDTQAVLDAVTPLTKIIWICSPNNPTGNVMQRDAIQTILENFAGLVVVDEAYIDFTDEPSWIQHLDQYPNLVVLQTFSKAWGLAGIRVGMCFASPELIRILNKIKPPYNISLPAQQALLEGLNGIGKKDRMVADILEQRDALTGMLQSLPIVVKIHPTDANFLLVQFEDAKGVMDYLIHETIIVRDRSRVHLCEGCLRITVGTKEENEVLIESLKKFHPRNVIV